MTLSFSNWSQHRLDEWVRIPETYTSKFGLVELSSGGEWIAKVVVRDKLYRLTETYASAEVAKMAVERTWRRENDKWLGKM